MSKEVDSTYLTRLCRDARIADRLAVGRRFWPADHVDTLTKMLRQRVDAIVHYVQSFSSTTERNRMLKLHLLYFHPAKTGVVIDHTFLDTATINMLIVELALHDIDTLLHFNPALEAHTNASLSFLDTETAIKANALIQYFHAHPSIVALQPERPASPRVAFMSDDDCLAELGETHHQYGLCNDDIEPICDHYLQDALEARDPVLSHARVTTEFRFNQTHFKPVSGNIEKMLGPVLRHAYIECHNTDAPHRCEKVQAVINTYHLNTFNKGEYPDGIPAWAAAKHFTMDTYTAYAICNDIANSHLSSLRRLLKWFKAPLMIHCPVNTWRATPLHYAAAYGNYSDTIAKGVIEKRYIHELNMAQRILHCAIQGCHADSTYQAVASNPDLADACQYTPLQTAALYGQLEPFKYLLRLSVAVWEKTAAGDTLGDLAMASRCIPLITFCIDYGLIQKAGYVDPEAIPSNADFKNRSHQRFFKLPDMRTRGTTRETIEPRHKALRVGVLPRDEAAACEAIAACCRR